VDCALRGSVLAGAVRFVVVAVSVRRRPLHVVSIPSASSMGRCTSDPLSVWCSSAARCLRFALVVLRVAPIVTVCSGTSFSRFEVLRGSLVVLRVAHAVRSRSVFVAERVTKCAARALGRNPVTKYESDGRSPMRSAKHE